MLLGSQKAEKTFRKIKQVRDEIRTFCLASDRPVIYAKEIHQVVQQMYSLDIEVWEVTFQATHLRGMVERYKSKSYIYLRAGQEPYWRRFSEIKELCHLIIDEEEDWSCNGDETIAKFLAENQFISSQIADPVAQSETFAELGAIELLYPYLARCKDKASGTPIEEIADYYEIPTVLISRYLADQYHSIAKKLWEKIGLD